MLKKIMLLISCFGLLILVACGYAGDIPTPTADVERGYMRVMTFPSAVSVGTEHVTIEVATAARLAEIKASDDWDEQRHFSVDFAEATGGFITEGVTLIFTVQESITDLSFTEDVNFKWSDSFGILTMPSFSGAITGFPLGTQLVLTNFPLGQIASVWYTAVDGKQYSYRFSVNANGELVSEQWNWLRNYEHYDDGSDNSFEDLEIDLEGEFLMLMLDQLSILPMELIFAEDDEVDWQAIVRNIIGQNQASHIVNFDYDKVFFSRPMADLNRMMLPQGDFLLIVPTITIHDVEIVSLEAVDGDFQTNFRIVDRFGVIDEISAGAGLLIHNYLSVGHFPLSGITFTNEFGSRMYYLIFQDHSDQFPPYRLIPFIPY